MYCPVGLSCLSCLVFNCNNLFASPACSRVPKACTTFSTISCGMPSKHSNKHLRVRCLNWSESGSYFCLRPGLLPSLAFSFQTQKNSLADYYNHCTIVWSPKCQRTQYVKIVSVKSFVVFHRSYLDPWESAGQLVSLLTEA